MSGRIESGVLDEGESAGVPQVGMQRLTGFTINRTIKLKMSRFINCKGSCKQSVSVARNENCYTSGAPAKNVVLIRDTEATTHSRLTMTEETNSKALFPPENVWSR